MRLVVLMLFAAMPFSLSPVFAAQISNDGGGRIGTYVQKFTRLRDSGQPVVVKGQCLSACTLVLALVPRDRICVTPEASFGFHAAWSPDSAGDVAVNPEATRLLWNMYPPRIRAWIRANGGLRRNMIYLRGRQLAALYRPCSPALEHGDYAVAAHRPNGQAGRSPETGRSVARIRPMLERERAAAIDSDRPLGGPGGWR